MVTSFSIAIQVILISLVLFFAIFTGYEFFSSNENRKNKKKSKSSINHSSVFVANDYSNSNADTYNNRETDTSHAICSILLPVCNEVLVVEQLISAVYRIEVPKHCEVEILILDDSSDDNADVIKKIVDNFINKIQGQQFEYPVHKEIFYHHRPICERNGFKAGNISYGLKFSKGDFIVIFDADCIPPQNFLKDTIPYFKNEKVGFLQTAIEFYNRTENFITRFLALETSHKDDITSKQSNSQSNNYCSENLNVQNDYQDFASLTGSSCIWRKSCLDEIGGFSSATLTEDIDLCYRAQLHGWQYIYAENAISTEELPNRISGLRIQRHRWAYGLIRNAFMYTSKVLRVSDFSFCKKFKVFMLISQTFLLASFVVLLFLSLPLVFVTDELGTTFNITCTVFLLTTILWGYNNLSTGKNRIDRKSGVNNLTTSFDDNEKEKRETNDSNIRASESIVSVHKFEGNIKQAAPISFFEYVGYILLYLPLSLYYFTALIENIFGLKVSFIPTEKKGFSNKKSSIQVPFKNKTSLANKSKNNFYLFGLEIFCFVYALVVNILSIYLKNWWTLLYGAICFLGFGIAIWLSILEHSDNKK